MKKVFLVFLALAILFPLYLSAAQKAAAPPETIVIKSNVFKTLRYAPVAFSHKTHSKITCTECHHKWDKTKQATPKKCDECHGLKKQGKELSLKMAFHKNCRGCHRKMKKEGKTTGPTRCSKCHVKK